MLAPVTKTQLGMTEQMAQDWKQSRMLTVILSTTRLAIPELKFLVPKTLEWMNRQEVRSARQ
jgi:hypothetical protein